MSDVAAFGRGGSGGAFPDVAVAADVVVNVGVEPLATAFCGDAVTATSGISPSSATSEVGLGAVGVGVSPCVVRSSMLDVFFLLNPRGRLPNTDKEPGGDDGDGDFDIGEGDPAGGVATLGAVSSTSVASVLCEESVPRSGSSSSSSLDVMRASLASSSEGVIAGASPFSMCQKRLASCETTLSE